MSNLSETRHKFSVTVTMKSGVQLSAQCDSFKVIRNALGELSRFEWENMSAQWMHVDLGQVAAVVCEELSS